jgi:hypothetical protein
MEEALLVQAWQNKIVKAVPPPSKDEIDQFVAAHPELYGARNVFLIDQIRFPLPSDQAVLKKIEPLNTLQDVARVLSENNVRFRASKEAIDPLAVGPDLIAAIVKLAPGSLFVVPMGQVVTVNQVYQTVPAPVPSEIAYKHATQVITQQRSQLAVRKEFGGAMAAAKEKIKLNKAYEPPAAPKAPAKGKAAPAPAPAAAPPAAAPAAP